MRLVKTLLIAAAALAFTGAAASAGSTLNRIRSQNVIRCGAKPRPGLVQVEEDGHAAGLLLDLCRAIGAGVLGPDGRIEFTQYDSAKAFDAVRNGTDDIFFLDGSDIIDQKLADKLLPGPPVFYERTAVMVSDTSPVQHVGELAGKAICVSQGSNGHRHLEAWFAAHHLDFQRMAYQEDLELLDTYNAQVCPAIAAEETTLGDMRLDPGVNHLRSRMLPESLTVFPITAATSLVDPEWSAVVSWSVTTLIQAGVPGGAWASGGLDALRVSWANLGVDASWQKRIVKAAGTYDDMFARNLGDRSPLLLARGLNTTWDQGGLFAPLHAD